MNYLIEDYILLPAESNTHKFYRLKAMVEVCKKCKLHSTRTQAVFGYGNPASRVMVVGEAPGGNEDLYGKPFIGKAGERFSKFLKKYGIDRDRDFFITNVVKCRPPKNRDPEPDEIAACERYLYIQIKLIKPYLFLALGRYSGAWLLGRKNISMKELAGKKLTSKFGVPVIITYHPAAIDHARNPAIREFYLRHFQESIKLFAELIKEFRDATGN